MNRWPGVNWLWLPEVDSTNSLAERLLEAWFKDAEAELPTTLICADRQWAGRGRQDRVWQSPLGNVYVTLLCRQDLAALPWLPLAAAVALREGVLRLLPLAPVLLKWPNDLQAQGGKLGGVLCSSRVRGDKAWTITGLGLNVLTAPELHEEGRSAVNLRDLGFRGTLELARSTVLDTFVAEFFPLLRQPELLRERWLAASAHKLGDRLAVRTGTGVLEGTFSGLTNDGRLLLQVEGKLASLVAGELA